jgi:RNA polymerase sigma-70 factor (ECF subfamily)
MPSNSSSQGLACGQQEALPPFEMLYDRYHVQIYRYLYAHLGHEYDAADLVQQVFFQAWKQGQTYEPKRGSVATWLFSIAHHRLVDFYRVSRPSISWEAMSEITVAVEQNPEARVIETETIAQVKKLLEALSQAEREMLALRFAAQLSSAEIAPIIGKSEAATKKQLTRLLHRLQEQYRRQELEELIPELLEPADDLCAVLLQVYAVPLPDEHLRHIRQSLCQQIQSDL